LEETTTSSTEPAAANGGPAAVYATPNVTTPGQPVVFDASVCTGCNICVYVCLEDVFIPNPVKGRPPLILYPEECWYCGPCVEDCPHEGAIRLNHPLQQRVRWKRKSTGEHFRV
jgi:NAD-dependent dihydropyrimidine dehydrogenase PreA subunit